MGPGGLPGTPNSPMGVPGLWGLPGTGCGWLVFGKCPNGSPGSSKHIEIGSKKEPKGSQN